MGDLRNIGDPSLEFRINKPQSVVIEGIDNVLIGSPETSVHIKNASGEDIAGAKVVLVNPESQKSVTAVSNAQGIAVLTTGQIGTASAGLNLKVFGSHITSIERSVPMIAPNGPFLGFSKWHTNSRSSNRVFVNEKVMLGAIVENFGSVASSQSTIVISEVKGPAKILSGSALIPAVNVREKVEIGSGLQIEVLSTAQKDELVQVSLIWTTPEGASGTTKISLPVVRGELMVNSVDYGSPTVEGISGSGEIFVTVKNTGNEVVRDAKLTFAPGSCSTAATGSAFIEVLNPGDSVRLAQPIAVEQDASCESGSFGKVKIQGDYAGTAGRPTLSSEAAYLVGLIEIFNERQQAIALAIPDNASEISKDFVVGDTGKLKDISVSVKILHPYVGDLVVSVKSPSGKKVLLRSRQGASDDDLNVRWGFEGTPVADLATLKDEEVHGTWSILVQDSASGDRGTWKMLRLC